MKLRALILAVIFSSSCHAAYFDTITVFGGSYADIGMGYLISTAGPPNSPIPPSPPYYQGKFSDGPIYLNYLPPLIDANYPLLSVAVGGSTPGTGNAEDIFNVRGLGGVANQIQRFYTTFQNINPQSLTILEAGLDAFLLLAEQGRITDPTAVAQTIQTVISDLKSDIVGIKQLGANQIVVYTLPDPNTIPLLKDSGAVIIFDAAADAVNTALRLIPKTDNQDVFIYDFYKIADDVLTQYAASGGNITDHTLTIVTSDPFVVVQNGPPPNNLAYWDGIHFTTQIQKILAQYLASVLNTPRSIGAQADLAFLSDQTQYDLVETRLAAITRNWITCCEPECGNHLIFDVGGKWGCKKSKTRDYGFDFDNYHLSVGYDTDFADCFYAGILSSWIWSEGFIHRNRGNIILQDWANTFYGTYFYDCFSLDAQAAFHYLNFKTNRSNLVFSRHAKAWFDGFSPTLSLKGSYYMSGNLWYDLIFAPFISADYGYVTIDSYHESGAGLLDVKMPSQDQNSLIGKIGLRAFTQDCTCSSWDLQIGYEREFLRYELNQIRPVFFDIPNNHLLYKRNRPDRDFLRFLARRDYHYCDNLVFTLEYIGFYGLNRKSQYNNTVKLEALLTF